MFLHQGSFWPEFAVPVRVPINGSDRTVQSFTKDYDSKLFENIQRCRNNLYYIGITDK